MNDVKVKKSQKEKILTERKVSVLIRKAVKNPMRDDWQTYEFGCEAMIPDNMTLDEGYAEITIEAIKAIRKAYRNDYAEAVKLAEEKEQMSKGINGVKLLE